MPADPFVSLNFPRAGIDLSSAFMRQPNRAVDGASDYARTTPLAVNVWGNEALTQRGRGGSRAGLKKYIAAPLVAGWIVQELAVIVTENPAAKSP